jgi:hypothetical protein
VVAPIWSFDESAEIVHRLLWEDRSQENGKDSLDQRLLERLNRATTELFQGELRKANPIADLPAHVKERVIRHPYVAGFASGRLALDRQQVQFHVSEALRECQSFSANSEDQTVPDHYDSSATIKICYDGSLTLPNLVDGRSWVSSYDSCDFLRLRGHIETALSHILLVNRSTFDFIQSYLRYISIRRNMEKPNRFGTYTFPMLPGLLVICNAEVSTVDSFLIEETLVHEAIHCFLDWVEGEGTTILRVQCSDTKVTSPWTGNPLDVDTAFHATLVWFGLGQYFQKCIATEGQAAARRDRFESRLEFVHKGFKAENFLTFIDFLLAACNPGPCKVLDVIAMRYV